MAIEIITAIVQALASLNPNKPQVGVWLPEATFTNPGTVLDDKAFNRHYADWYSRIVSVAGQVNVVWVGKTRIDENGISTVVECVLSPTATVEPVVILGVRK